MAKRAATITQQVRSLTSGDRRADVALRDVTALDRPDVGVKLQCERGGGKNPGRIGSVTQVVATDAQHFTR